MKDNELKNHAQKVQHYLNSKKGKIMMQQIKDIGFSQEKTFFHIIAKVTKIKVYNKIKQIYNYLIENKIIIQER